MVPEFPLIFLIVGAVGAMVAHEVSDMNDEALDGLESPGTVEARVIEADQHARGSADVDGRGSVFGFSFDGEASYDGKAGRLSVALPLREADRFLDLEVSRSRFLALRERGAESVDIDVRYVPCFVPRLNDVRVCYQVAWPQNGAFVETANAFEANVATLMTDWDTGPDEYMQGWWDEYGGEGRFAGHLSSEATEEILERAYERHHGD